ncbi:MAG: replicative DNA helicase [Mycoplasma sp.]
MSNQIKAKKENNNLTEEQKIQDDVANERLQELEKTVLGSLLSNNALINHAITKLQPEDFYFQHNRAFYEAIINANSEGRPINFDAIYNYFRNDRYLQKMYSDEEIQTLYDEIEFKYPNDLNYEYSVDFVKSYSIYRQAHELTGNFLDKTFNYSDKFKEENFDYLRKFSDIIHSNTDNKMQGVNEIVNEMITDFDRYEQELINNNDRLTGLDTGFSGINDLTSGFQKGDLVILAARPGTGKTALALNFIMNVCKNIRSQNQHLKPGEKPKVVVLFSIEMGKKQIVERMLAALSRIEISTIKRGVFNEDDRININKSLEELKTYPLKIDDSSGLSILDIQAKLKQLETTYEISFVVLDYLQLLKGPQKKNSRNFSRQEEVSEISRMLKVIARDINTPLLALAQLSRKIEERRGGMNGENPKPLLSDLRESGSIEQDADIVTFLYYKRDPYLPNEASAQEHLDDMAKKEVDPIKLKRDNPYETVQIQFTIEKHRNGPTGEVPLSFIKGISLFVDNNDPYKIEPIGE